MLALIAPLWLGSSLLQNSNSSKFDLDSASPVAIWNEVCLEFITLSQSPPPPASRTLAMVSIAQFDAVNAVDRKYQSYLLKGQSISSAKSSEVNKELVKFVAAHAAAKEVLLDLHQMRRRRTELQYQSSIRSLMAQPDLSVSISEGERIGKLAAAAILKDRENDGSQLSMSVTSFPPAKGVYQEPTTGDFKRPTPGWANVKPFCLNQCDEFRPSEIPLSSERYLKGLSLVSQIGRADSSIRTADQTWAAKFWNYGGGSITPPGAWNEIAARWLESRKIPLLESARAMALLNIGLADTSIACWEAKYHYSLWRPVTAIRVEDPAWKPLLGTPNHPSFPSGHSTYSRCGATILGAIFADQDQSFEFRGDKPGGYKSRSYQSFDQAATEAGMSRVWGGIHYPFDNEEGQKLGKSVAEMVLRQELQPLN